MRGSEGGEGCWMFGGSGGGGLHRHSSGPTSYRSHPSRRRILHHTCKCLSRLKAISQHLPPMSLQESEPRIHFFFSLFLLFRSQALELCEWAWRAGPTSVSKHSPGMISRKWVGWLGRLKGESRRRGGGARQGHGDSSKHVANRGGKVSRRNCKSSSRCWLKRHICSE